MIVDVICFAEFGSISAEESQRKSLPNKVQFGSKLGGSL